MSFRPIRRFKQQLSEEECLEILRANSSGVLSVIGDEGYPYGVPLSYVYDSGILLFHCALMGHKIDAIRRCDKVSFCVIDQDEVSPAEFTTHYRSVIIFGRIRICTEGEKMAALDMLEKKYVKGAGDYQKELLSIDRLNVLELAIEDIKGKQAKELISLN